MTILENRALGESFTVSVGTALPFEKILSDDKIMKELNADAVAINLSTLFRNYYNSFDELDIISDEAFITGFIEEIEIIRGLLRSVKVKLATIYYINYDVLLLEFPNASIKTAKTDNQLAEKQKANLAMSAAMAKLDYIVKLDSTILPAKNVNVLMLTHHPVDLLNLYQFSDLKLLESHSASVRENWEWYKKLTGRDKNIRLPFNRLTLSCIGDNSVNFLSQPKYARILRKAAEECNWTSSTSSAKVKKDLKSILDDDQTSLNFLLKIM